MRLCDSNYGLMVNDYFMVCEIDTDGDVVAYYYSDSVMEVLEDFEDELEMEYAWREYYAQLVFFVSKITGVERDTIYEFGQADCFEPYITLNIYDHQELLDMVNA